MFEEKSILDAESRRHLHGRSAQDERPVDQNWPWCGRAIVGIFLATTLTWCAGTTAAAGTDLYRAKVTVTGQGEANRIVGFAACSGGRPDQGIRRTEAQWRSGDWPPTSRRQKISSRATAIATSFLANPFVTSRAPATGRTISPWSLRKARSTTFSGRLASSPGFHIVRALPSLSRWSKARETIS